MVRIARATSATTNPFAPSAPAWNDSAVAEDVLSVLAHELVDVQRSAWESILSITTDGIVWELRIEVVRASSIAVALLAVSDNWAADPEKVAVVETELHRAARVYATFRNIEVLVGPVPRW